MLRYELFAEEMVRAYLEGRKKHTCRPVKPQPPKDLQYPYGFISTSSDRREEGKFCWTHEEICDGRIHTARPKHQPGDYIYCRETWTEIQGAYFYKADIPPEIIGLMDAEGAKWRPSIHMPKEAARLFFQVTKVGVIRLDDATEEFAQDDGFKCTERLCGRHGGLRRDTALERFQQFWLESYEPDAQWMWVYWTEICSKEEATERESK